MARSISARSAVEFVVLIENVGDERVGLNRRVRLSFQLNLHVPFLSGLRKTYRRRERDMASSASRLASFCRSDSRRSWNFLPFAIANSHFAMPSRK